MSERERKKERERKRERERKGKRERERGKEGMREREKERQEREGERDTVLIEQKKKEVGVRELGYIHLCYDILSSEPPSLNHFQNREALSNRKRTFSFCFAKQSNKHFNSVDLADKKMHNDNSQKWVSLNVDKWDALVL